MITVQIIDDETGRSGTAIFPSEFGPAFRSMTAERRNEVGERSAGIHVFDKEDALTRAMAAWGQWAAAVNRAIPKEDPDYE